MAMPDCGFQDVEQFCKKGMDCPNLKVGRVYCKYFAKSNLRPKRQYNGPGLDEEDELVKIRLELQETNHLLERIATALEGRR